MTIEVRWIHHASFRITDGRTVLYVDPWKIDGEPHDADVVFVSHAHYDHFSRPDIEKVAGEDCVIVAPPDVIESLHAANAVEPDERLTIGDVTIETVAAYNVGKDFHPRDSNWCGGVFTLGGKRIYYAGDTDLIPEMNDLAEIDLALLPVGGTYTLDADEAAAACRSIGCEAAIPYHWGDIVGSGQDAERFAAEAPCTVHLLRPGESLEL